MDDNLIGNKKAVAPLLEALAAWQEAHGFPFIFVTEASLDLAEDARLMRLMLDANILSVFVGIESPNEASLLETRKHQNVKTGRTLVERVRAIQHAGLEVWSGMIVGFDHDDDTVFSAQEEFLEQASIAQTMIGMLYAIPKTPLYGRLLAEGRLDPDDDSPFGTNVVPARLTRAALRDGFVRLMEDIYRPDAYFDRLAAGLGNASAPFAPARARYWKRHPIARAKGQAKNLVRAAALFVRLMRRVGDPDLRARYRRELREQGLSRGDPGFAFGYLVRCAMHYHHLTLAREMTRHGSRVVNAF